MRRKPSIKQQFIKEYAKLVYGLEAKSNALNSQDRYMIREAFEGGLNHEDLLTYVIWLQDNWQAICRGQLRHKGNFQCDLTRPGYYLFTAHFLNSCMYYALKGVRYPS